MKMLGGMLVRRAVAAADVTALCAAPQMKPPCAGSQTFFATGSRRFRRRIDPEGFHRHGVPHFEPLPYETLDNTAQTVLERVRKSTFFENIACGHIAVPLVE